MSKKYKRKELMNIAIENHLKSSGFPRVWAVIAKNGVILATGFRGESDGNHAERIAIEKLNPSQLKDSVLYTTLEPCVKIDANQNTVCCSELIVNSGIKEVVIGVLDTNWTIYAQGYKTLLANKISVSFFNRELRKSIEKETFEFNELHKLVWSWKRRIPVVQSGIEMTIQFSEQDARFIEFRWSTLQPLHGIVDLIGDNGSIRKAVGAKKFSDITDPTIFRFPSHYARMEKGEIAIVKPSGSTFCLLIKLLEIYKNDILFQWEVRNDN